MNETLDHIFKAVSATLIAVAHPDPISVINAIKADYEVGDDIFKVIEDNVKSDDHIQSLMTAKQAQDMIDDVNNDKPEELKNDEVKG